MEACYFFIIKNEDFLLHSKSDFELHLGGKSCSTEHSGAIFLGEFSSLRIISCKSRRQRFLLFLKQFSSKL